MRRIISILVILFAVCGCNSAWIRVHDKYREARRHNGDILCEVSVLVDGVGYSQKVLYHVVDMDDYGYISTDPKDFEVYLGVDYLRMSAPVTLDSSEGGTIKTLFDIENITGGPWVKEKRYPIGTEVSEPEVVWEKFGFIAYDPAYRWQIRTGWVSFRPLDDGMAFEMRFEFDAVDADGKVWEFREGRFVSEFRDNVLYNNHTNNVVFVEGEFRFP